MQLTRHLLLSVGACGLGCVGMLAAFDDSQIGRELAIPVHLQNGQEYTVPTRELIKFGKKLFMARWTSQEGAGRPLTKGTGNPLSDPLVPLAFPRNFNRISGPDTNSCAGCHSLPDIGGGGDIVDNVFVLGQRFDFATFNATDSLNTKGEMDERGLPVTLQTIANSRKTIGMFGSGFVEMLARQITADLQATAAATARGTASALTSKGISFGQIICRADGTWDTSRVEGIPEPSLVTSGSTPPSLIIRPFHQSGNVISLRQFTNNAFNHHHGIQSEERFGAGVDADGDGIVNELTRADVTAVTLFQATLPVPIQVIPNDVDIANAISSGRRVFLDIGCGGCHLPQLPLQRKGWIYTEPNPYNPPGNLQLGDAPVLAVDLTSHELPGPRLKPTGDVVWVPAFTDFKLHDITSGSDDPNREPLDMNQPAGSQAFFFGNGRFIARRLWGVANQHPFGHHGMYTTMREAVLAHHGEAESTYAAFQNLSKYDQDCVIEFLKSLRIVPDKRPEHLATEPSM
jgi:hypothetical protein